MAKGGAAKSVQPTCQSIDAVNSIETVMKEVAKHADQAVPVGENIDTANKKAGLARRQAKRLHTQQMLKR